MALTAKQQIFIDEYLKTRNATQAALAAGYSEKSACAIGWENLRKPEIDEAVKQRLDENAMSANEVLAGLADQARGDIGDFLTTIDEGEDENITITVDLAKAIKAKKTGLIKKLSQTRTVRYRGDDETEETVSTTIELYDRQAALALLAKHHKLLTDKQELTGKDGAPLENELRISHDLTILLKKAYGNLSSE